MSQEQYLEGITSLGIGSDGIERFSYDDGNGLHIDSLRKMEGGKYWPWKEYFVDEDGVEQGPFLGYEDSTKNKLLQKGVYLNGELYGKFESYHQPGQVARCAYFQKDGSVSFDIDYHKNGRIRRIHRLLEKEQCRFTVTFYPDGHVQDAYKSVKDMGTGEYRLWGYSVSYGEENNKREFIIDGAHWRPFGEKDKWLFERGLVPFARLIAAQDAEDSLRCSTLQLVDSTMRACNNYETGVALKRTLIKSVYHPVVRQLIDARKRAVTELVNSNG